MFQNLTNEEFLGYFGLMPSDVSEAALTECRRMVADMQVGDTIDVAGGDVVIARDSEGFTIEFVGTGTERLTAELAALAIAIE